jgi:hypothetical protein
MSLFPTTTALPHTVSQDLQANHDGGKQPRSRHGDSPVQSLCLSVCLEPTSIHRAIVSVFLCLAPCAPIICVTRAHFFFLPQGFQKITWGLLALSLMLSAQHGDRLQASRQKIGEYAAAAVCGSSGRRLS